MSSYRALAASVIAAVTVPLLAIGPSSALVASDSGTAARTSDADRTKTSFQSLTRKKAQSARISVLPKIAQKGSGVKNADKAKAVGEVKFSPAKEGRKVQVYRSSDGGTTWTKWGDVRKQDKKGIVRFAPAAPLTGAHWTYKAEAKKQGSLARIVSNPVTDRWALLMEDQFSGSRLDARWNTRGDFYDKGSQRKCAKASPKMAQVGKGALTLKVKKDPKRRGDVCKWRSPAGKIKKFNYYLNGHVGTDQTFSFRYGTAAARVKFQKPQGMHGSFWMNTSGEPEGRKNVEIDAVEFFGKDYNKGGLAQFLHFKGRKIGGLQPSANDVLTGTDNWWKKYHVFSVVWTPSGYSFRIDGTETFRTTKAVSDKQVIMILSLLSSDWELDDMSKTGKGSMKIDWVRVWQDQGIAARNLQ
jgi:beta-glucanase (GH16 family)